MGNTTTLGNKSKIRELLDSFGLPRLIIACILLQQLIAAPSVPSNGIRSSSPAGSRLDPAVRTRTVPAAPDSGSKTHAVGAESGNQGFILRLGIIGMHEIKVRFLPHAFPDGIGGISESHAVPPHVRHLEFRF